MIGYLKMKKGGNKLLEQLMLNKCERGVGMEKFHKLFPLLLAVVMVLACSASVFATGSGMITVNGTVSGQTCELYRMFSSTDSNYDVNAAWNDFFSGKGSGFICDKNNSAGSLKQVDFNGAKKYINITDGNITDFAKKASDYASCMKPDTVKQAEGSCVKFNNLGYGYYLVFAKGTGCAKSCMPSVCCITPKSPDKTINEKTEYPSIDKKADDETVDIGQTVNYTVTGKVPDTTGYATYQYRLADEMSSGLTFNKDVEAFIGGNKIKADVVYEGNGFRLSVNMKEYQAKAGEKVEVKYSAVVNKNAVIGAEGNPNKATLTYSSNPKDSSKTSTTPPVIVKVYTAGIKIFKYAKSGFEEKALASAEFVLMNKDGKYYRFTPASGNNAEKVEWVSDKKDATIVITGNDGMASFKGLESGQYSIEEIVAPQGYNLLSSPVNVTVDHKAGCAMSSVKIENKKGPSFPETGGVGTVLFYCIGGLMALSAVVMMLIGKKRV